MENEEILGSPFLSRSIVRHQDDIYFYERCLNKTPVFTNTPPLTPSFTQSHRVVFTWPDFIFIPDTCSLLTHFVVIVVDNHMQEVGGGVKEHWVFYVRQLM